MSTAPWYTYPRIDNIGSPDPYGGFPKPDSNVQLPSGYPITSLYAGTVSAIDTTSSWGCSITIKLDSPLNALATHTAYLHLQGIAPGISVGTHVTPGQLIGYNGGSSACGSQKVPLGFALYPGDNYGFGAAWQILLNNVMGLLNPVPILNAFQSGQSGGPPQSAGQAGSATSSCNWYCWLFAGSPWVPPGCDGCGFVTSPSGSSSSSSQAGPLVGILNWISNPVRIVKMFVGVMLIGITLLMMIAPESGAATVVKKALPPMRI